MDKYDFSSFVFSLFCKFGITYLLISLYLIFQVSPVIAMIIFLVQIFDAFVYCAIIFELCFVSLLAR